MDGVYYNHSEKPKRQIQSSIIRNAELLDFLEALASWILAQVPDLLLFEGQRGVLDINFFFKGLLESFFCLWE